MAAKSYNPLALKWVLIFLIIVMVDSQGWNECKMVAHIDSLQQQARMYKQKDGYQSTNVQQQQQQQQQSGGVDTSIPMNVLHAQLKDLQSGSTMMAYQLASPGNRRFTARPGGHSYERFNNMVHHFMYKPLLSGNGYKVLYHGYMNSHRDKYFADVKVYKAPNKQRSSAYRFLMSLQYSNVVDEHRSLGPYKMSPGHVPVWRTDTVQRMY